MTVGQILFFTGIGLLVFTIILGIIFWVKNRSTYLEAPPMTMRMAKALKNSVADIQQTA